MAEGYTRAELLAICEKAFVHQDKWRNRDSSHSMRQLGECYALLKAECEFTVLYRNAETSGRFDLSTDARTIWVSIKFRGFSWFEERADLEEETYWLPTPARLEAADGEDWY